MMHWTVTFNDGAKTTVAASWVIEAVVEACTHIGRPYQEVVSAHQAYKAA